MLVSATSTSRALAFCIINISSCLNQMDISSNIGTDRPGFLGHRKGTAGRRKGTAGCRKPQQGAALISMRERRALIGRKAYVYPVT